MDGNGRWAQKRGLPRLAGHEKGAETLQEVVKAAVDLGVRYLTVYAFSTENWNRDKEEVSGLMKLLRKYMNSEFKPMQEEGVRILFMGERDMLDADIVEQMAKIERDSKANDKFTLCIALSYGSRQEIVSAVKKIALLAKKEDINIKDIDARMVADMLYTRSIPDPDIVIRTSGEKRISNYLLWQIAYSELFFTPTLWPDFGREELEQIISEFKQRERRYGKN
ncbi:MAG: di-trans,poly-cis-decaprenylcistransferase [Alphaproteobacteria bacterium]|nr:di-trans,poly-cis-decaprenylcistransferase [Alphaproteobacteria bacterium]